MCTSLKSGYVSIYLYLHYLVLSLPSQILMIMVMTMHRYSGVYSSGLALLFWLVLIIYGAFKLRTLILTAEDEVCTCTYTYTYTCL